MEDASSASCSKLFSQDTGGLYISASADGFTPAFDGLKYLEGGKAELGLNVQRPERGYINAERSENGFAERHRRGQGSISSGMKRTDRDMQQENMAKGRRASNEMCTFLILNISSLQLIPVNMIAYRAQYGSANPTAIIVPAIAATLFSSFVAVVYCKMKDHGKGRGGKLV